MGRVTVMVTAMVMVTDLTQMDIMMMPKSLYQKLKKEVIKGGKTLKIEVQIIIEMETQNTILITGGAGFIGSNCVNIFLSKGNKVICLDNFATGHRHNLKDFVDHPN
jgi:FlaA1/EpsC-like NDP-sugar epimerase